jgi:hypothetical protein
MDQPVLTKKKFLVTVVEASRADAPSAIRELEGSFRQVIEGINLHYGKSSLGVSSVKELPSLQPSMLLNPEPIGRKKCIARKTCLHQPKRGRFAF